MAEKEDRWRVAPFVPNPHSRPEERIARALEYIATQIGQINQKMDYFRRVRSTGQCNTACSLSAGVWKPKVFRGRWLSRRAIAFR